jgi:hypothetical protein
MNEMGGDAMIMGADAKDSPIKALANLRDSLIRHGIYLLPEASGIRGYDMALLLLPDGEGDDQRKPSFLKILREVVIAGESTTYEQAPNLQKELAGWLGISAEDAKTRAVDWLKIAVDQFPFRLFVVHPDNLQWASDEPNTHKLDFFKKRICWIKGSEFERHILVEDANGGASAWEDNLILWLKATWVKHVVKEVRGLSEIAEVHLRVCLEEDDSSQFSPLPVPDSVPAKLRGEYTGEAQNAIRFALKFNADNADGEPSWSILNSENPGAVTANVLFCSIERHLSFYRFSPPGEVALSVYVKTYYENALHDASIVISGSSASFGPASQALVKAQSAWNYVFDTLAGMLLRTGIVDERVQEWYAGLGLEPTSPFGIGQRHVDVLGSHVTPAYLDGCCYQQHQPIPVWSTKIIVPKEEKLPTVTMDVTMDYDGREMLGKVREMLGKVWASSQRSLDVVVLHVGILDKKIKDDPNLSTSFSARIMEEVLRLKQIFPFVVLTSGRGQPESLPPVIKFLPYSGIETCVSSGTIDKVLLMRGLLAV